MLKEDARGLLGQELSSYGLDHPTDGEWQHVWQVGAYVGARQCLMM